MRRLIVNADDLGYDPEIDRGILEAHARGVASSASAMVDTPFAEAALRLAPRSLGLGLHLVLADGREPAALVAEVVRQVERFRALRGAEPTHLDSHRHAHARPAVLAAVAEVALLLGLPVRALDAAMREALRARGVPTADGFLGDASLRPCWTLARLVAAIAGVAEGPPGTFELMAHPGHAPARVRTSFGAEREVELAALCAPEVRQALARGGVSLATWEDIPR